MNDDVIDLDAHRDLAAGSATEVGRLSEVEADQVALRQRKAELEKFLLATPAATWSEAADRRAI